MESTGGEGARGLLEAQAHIWNHIFSFINSMSLKCAVEIGIPDAIHNHGKPMTISELAAALSIPPTKTPCLQRLMRLLVLSGFFARHHQVGKEEEEEEDLFSLTHLSSLLVRQKDGCISPFLLLMLDQTLLSPWHHLGSWFKGDVPSTPFEMAHGKGLWEKTRDSPVFNRMINEGMASDSRFVTALIIRECGDVFKGLRSLVDVGGGTGTTARAIAEAYPKVKCTVLDLPHVVANLEDMGPVHVVGGDMFQQIPHADAMFLKWVLHDWNDEDCVRILKRCKEATPSKEEGGKVIIIDMVVNIDANHPELAETQLLFDLHMMTHTMGKQRCEHEWRRIFTDAGFRDYKIMPMLGLRAIMEVYH